MYVVRVFVFLVVHLLQLPIQLRITHKLLSRRDYLCCWWHCMWCVLIAFDQNLITYGYNMHIYNYLHGFFFLAFLLFRFIWVGYFCLLYKHRHSCRIPMKKNMKLFSSFHSHSRVVVVFFAGACHAIKFYLNLNLLFVSFVHLKLCIQSNGKFTETSNSMTFSKFRQVKIDQILCNR